MINIPATILILDNIRSCYNVGSIFRTADAAGIGQLILTGITPAPPSSADPRPAHVQAVNGRQIAKTALGAEQTVPFRYAHSALAALAELRQHGQHTAYALEITENAFNIFEVKPQLPAILLLGQEVEGLSRELLAMCDQTITIPMRGRKESLNVAVAAGLAAYWLTGGLNTTPLPPGSA